MKLIGVLILCMGFFLTGEAEEINQENSCQCAVFDKDQLTADAKLLMKQTLMMDFNCSDDSNATDFCKNVCISLTLAPICEAKKIFMHNIKPAVFFRVCDIEDWQYCGIVAHEICSREKAVAIFIEAGLTTHSTQTPMEGYSQSVVLAIEILTVFVILWVVELVIAAGFLRQYKNYVGAKLQKKRLNNIKITIICTCKKAYVLFVDLSPKKDCEAAKVHLGKFIISCPKKGPCSGTTPAHVSCVCEESCKCECREESTEPENCEDTKHTDTVTSSVPESTEEIQLTGLSSKAPVGGSSKV